MAKGAASPLSASLLGVPKGSAAPPHDAVTSPEPPEYAADREQEGHAARRLPAMVPPPAEEAKSALTVRLPLTTQERLREAAHRMRREKQAIVDEALGRWLDEHGF